MDWLWLLVAAATGGLAGFLVTFWVARRVWHNARRLSARAKGREHLVELGQLAGGLAHEIKNPLSTINVNLKLLSEDIEVHDDEMHRRWLRRLHGVQEEADRLRGILEDFLRYAGKVELHPESTDLRNLVQELSDFFAPQAQASRVIMRTSLPETQVRCRIDANLVKQAVLNLLINAVQAMQDGGGELMVRLSSQRGRALLEVIDTGPGITPESLAKVFQVYYSTKKGGSGLGLATTRRIVHEHEGTIRVDSEPGKGTRFTISLPLDSAGRAEA